MLDYWHHFTASVPEGAISHGSVPAPGFFIIYCLVVRGSSWFLVILFAVAEEKCLHSEQERWWLGARAFFACHEGSPRSIPGKHTPPPTGYSRYLWRANQYLTHGISDTHIPAEMRKVSGFRPARIWISWFNEIIEPSPSVFNFRPLWSRLLVWGYFRMLLRVLKAPPTSIHTCKTFCYSPWARLHNCMDSADWVSFVCFFSHTRLPPVMCSIAIIILCCMVPRSVAILMLACVHSEILKTNSVCRYMPLMLLFLLHLFR